MERTFDGSASRGFSSTAIPKTQAEPGGCCTDELAERMGVEVLAAEEEEIDGEKTVLRAMVKVLSRYRLSSAGKSGRGLRGMSHFCRPFILSCG